MASDVLISDLIEVPKQVNQGDFVLNLSDGVSEAEKTLRTYVVTDQLVRCFDQALEFIRTAVEGRTSKAAYLHGSFGSGKSHFMAVLHLLLQGNPGARSIRKLAPVCENHPWLGGRNFLLVPFHMIGAANVESALFGGYVRHIKKLHPEVSLPPLFLAESIFDNADVLRQKMGNEAFFAALNGAVASGSDEGDDRWGTIDVRWDSASFEAARRAPLRLEAEATEAHQGDTIGPRGQLVVDLVSTLLPAYSGLAEGKAEAYVGLDEGLSIISRHAKGLGYDAIVLFLDELILWLASHSADLRFLQTEGQKLAKLVEFEHSRPVPVISFVARQRDLRELVGEGLSGAEELNFADILRHWEGRFSRINLEDRNLPVIAQERLLKPKDDASRALIESAYQRTAAARQEVLDVLLPGDATREMFRLVYPFSPALVQTLIAISSALQRERTALRIMLDLLVRQRETLRLGDLIPVGDLWDVVAEGGERFGESLIRAQFDNARRLYAETLRPMLEDQYQLNLQHDLARAESDPEVAKKLLAFRTDDRLIKTLLLSALVPEVESLRSLTAAKLAALNHGTIRSPIPGREASIVLSKLRQWAGQVGEIKLEGDPNNPTITVQLSGVDVDRILGRAANYDNASNRKTLVRDMLFEALKIEGLETLQHYDYRLVWRGAERHADVVYANVRDLPDDSLRNPGPDWRLILDYPFDTEGHSPTEDLDRLDAFRQRESEPSKTLAWVPSFFSRRSLRDLGTLVVIEHILSGENFNRYVDHLQRDDWPVAHAILKNRQSALRIKVGQLLEAAYGIRPNEPGMLDESHDLADHVQSLDGKFRPRLAVGGTLDAALRKLVEQALAHQYPGHPEFPELVRTADLKVVLEHVRVAIADPAGRSHVEKAADRKVMERVAVPLRLGEMGATHFALSSHWRDHFQRMRSRTGKANPGVRDLREWIKEEGSDGLPAPIANLLALAYADATNRSFYLDGSPYHDARLDSLPERLELREQALPDEAKWERARQRAEAIFKVKVPHYRNANNVAVLHDEVRKKVEESGRDARELPELLRTHWSDLGGSPEQLAGSARIKSARSAEALLKGLRTEDATAAIEALADAPIETTPEDVGRCLATARQVIEALRSTQWELFQGLGRLDDDRRVDAEAILKKLREDFCYDERALTQGIAETLRQQSRAAAKLLASMRPTPVPPITPPPITPPPIGPEVDGTGFITLDEGGGEVWDASRLAEELESLKRRMEADSSLYVSVSWTLFKKDRA